MHLINARKMEHFEVRANFFIAQMTAV